MIPPEVKANELLIEAPISDWILQVMSTNWLGYWILQLVQKGQPQHAILISLDNLVTICEAIRSCIDTAVNSESNSKAKAMFVTAASNLPTQMNDNGAVTVMADWSSDPVIGVSYYGGEHGEGNVIRQALALDDAMRLSDMFATVYNRFPEKKSWKPRENK